MVVIKERKLLRCCFNCVNFKFEIDEERNDFPVKCECEGTPYGKTEVEPTGICEYFIRLS